VYIFTDGSVKCGTLDGSIAAKYGSVASALLLGQLFSYSQQLHSISVNHSPNPTSKPYPFISLLSAQSYFSLLLIFLLPNAAYVFVDLLCTGNVYLSYLPTA